MSDYYSELAQQAELARIDGWRQELTQFLRFEVVRRALAIEADEDVVDLGCGTGRLLAYLGSDRSGTYLGVDQLAHAVQRGRASLNGGLWLCADLFDRAVDDHGPFEWAVAIGSLVDGRERRHEGERRRGLQRLIGRLESLGSKGWALVSLNHRRLLADPVRRLEPCLKGATSIEIEALAKRRNIEVVLDEQVLPSEIFALRVRDEGPSDVRGRISGEKAHRAVLERAESMRGQLDAADVTAFWIAAGRSGRARQVWETIAEDHSRRDLLREQIRAMTAPK